MAGFTPWIGWFSSALLVLTLSKQIHKQWKEGTGEGVSKWLYIGQMATSIGFVVYSLLLRNEVFVVTNAMCFFAGLVGLVLLLLDRRKRSRAAARDDRRLGPARAIEHPPPPR